MMATTDTLAGAVDTITARLDARDLDGARRAFDDAVRGGQEAVEPLVRQLATTVVLPPGMVVWGHGIDVWANPHRYDRAWRCGGCPQTASHYKTERACLASAQKHVADDHGGRLTVVSYLDEAYWAAVEATERGAR